MMSGRFLVLLVEKHGVNPLPLLIANRSEIRCHMQMWKSFPQLHLRLRSTLKV